MNVYDFDKTIYDGDSTIDFYFHCLKRHPVIMTCIPRQAVAMVRYKFKKIKKTQLKEEFYCFLGKLKNIDEDLISFWDNNQHKIKAWYKASQQTDDLIISASPEFLLQEICNREKIERLIASRVDKKTGKYKGLNCYGMEKVSRYKEIYPVEKIESFFSDSKSDQPMADIAENAYLVKGESVELW